MRKVQLKISLLLVGIVLLCLLIWRMEAMPSRVVLSSQSGVWDLYGVCLEGGHAKLVGPVEYVPRALLTPEEFSRSDAVMLGTVPDGTAYLTSRIRILVPEDGFYGIAGWMADYGSRLNVNGEWLADSGKPADSKDENIAKRFFIQFTARSQDGVIEIVQQSSNFVFRSNSVQGGWLVGSPAAVAQAVAAMEYSGIIAIGLYIALGLVHLLLFLLVPRYRVNLWGALLCLLWVLRTGILRAPAVHALLPDLLWGVDLRIEYLTVVAAVVPIGELYNSFFPGMLSRRGRSLAYGFQGVFAAAYLLMDTLTMSRTIFLYLASAVWYIAYVFISFKRKVKKPDFKQKLSICGLFFILAGVVLDSLHSSIGVAMPFMHDVVTETALAVFSFFQMAAMLLGTMEEMAAAREAERRLIVENEALDRLNRLKTEFLSNVSHELKTPLTVVSGHAQISYAQLADTENRAVRDKMRIIASEADRLALMVGQVLDVTRIEEGRMTLEKRPCHIDELIYRAVETHFPILNKNGNRLEIKAGLDLPEVSADPGRITQVLVNLIANALRHTTQGLITVSTRKAGGFLEVSVSDTGTGIPPEDMDRLFTRFHPRSPGSPETGAGLGLYICKYLVEEHGGKITVESAGGAGTAVAFSLPLQAPAQGDGTQGDGSEQEDGYPVSLLV